MKSTPDPPSTASSPAPPAGDVVSTERIDRVVAIGAEDRVGRLGAGERVVESPPISHFRPEASRYITSSPLPGPLSTWSFPGRA
jgi:hypothetical protein